jgi:hypothetical protein
MNLANLLVVGAGGGSEGASFSATYAAGNGGAGGYLADTAFALTEKTYSVVVGLGGARGIDSVGVQGGNSSFDTLVAVGGGAGHDSGSNGGDGGSGAGGGSYWTRLGGNGTTGQGHKGGTGSTSGQAAGGSGGAYSAGGDASGSTGGTSGAGISNSITGSAVTYAVGPAGAPNGSTTGADGAVNTGNGGLSGGSNTAGKGGSGIVVISIPTDGSSGVLATSTLTGASNTKTTNGIYTVYTFKESGDFVCHCKPSFNASMLCALI